MSPQTSDVKRIAQQPKTIEYFFTKKIKTNTIEVEKISEQERGEEDLESSTMFFVCPHCEIYFEGNNDFFIQHKDICIE